MGGILKRTCPYCKTKHVAFNAFAEWKTQFSGQRGLFMCGSCGEGVIWEYSSTHSIVKIIGDLDKQNILFLRCWPEPPAGAAPEDTPLAVANFFEQGTSCLESGNFDAAGMMFRKTLESATKFIDPESSKKPLIKRIDELASAGKLTTELAGWAHEVRIGGNDAAHEDEPFSQEDADAIRNFIENFLRYIFTLPSAVKRRAKPKQEMR